MRRVLALAAVGVIAVVAPAGATAQTRSSAAVAPRTVAYSFPQQCVVIPVSRQSFTNARAILHGLGCRVRRRVETSTARRNLVLSVVGGERSYAYGHVVTLIVSSGSD